MKMCFHFIAQLAFIFISPEAEGRKGYGCVFSPGSPEFKIFIPVGTCYFLLLVLCVVFGIYFLPEFIPRF